MGHRRQRRDHHFYPRSPRGERPEHPPSRYTDCCNISIHAPREGSDASASCRARAGAISIHAPREGSDGLQVDALTAGFDISIHAPREGSD